MKRKKRVCLAVVLAAAMASTNLFTQIGSPVAEVYAADYDENGFWIENGVLKDYKGTEIHVVIPDGVTTIEKGAFKSSNVISVTVPDSVTIIGYSAFQWCEYLNKITLSKNLTVIGKDAFYGCGSLTSVVIPEKVTRIQQSTFDGCTNLASVTIPQSVTGIDERAFARTGLTDIQIPNSKAEFGEQVFDECTKLKSVVLPEECTVIPKAMFRDCTSLQDISLPQTLETINASVFENCSSLVNIAIPDRVKIIGGNAFYNCRLLENIRMTGVTNIGNGAFHGCEKLRNVTLPKGLTTIPEYLFSGCDTLTEIVIPDGVESIGLYAFGNCDNLRQITIPESVVSIHNSAIVGTPNCTIIGKQGSAAENFGINGSWVAQFRDEKGFITKENALTSYVGEEVEVEIPQRVTSIEMSAFEKRDDVTKIMIPKTVTEIVMGAFADCSALTEFEVAEDNPNYCSKDGLLYSKNGDTLIACPGARDSVALADSVTIIGEKAFANCRKLTVVTLPNTVSNIVSRAFDSCGGLTSLNVPESVRQLGEEVFKDCNTLTVTGVQGSYIDEYLRTENVPFLDDKGFKTARSELLGYTGTETDIVLPTKITTIGNRAFADCVSLEGVTITENVTEIRDHAFSNCTNLRKVIVVDERRIQEIGDNAFEGCGQVVLYGNDDSYSMLQLYASRHDLIYVQENESGSMSIQLPHKVTVLSRETIDEMKAKNKTEDTFISVRMDDDAFGLGSLQYIFRKGTMTRTIDKENYDFGAEITDDYSSLTKPAFKAEDFVFAIKYNYEGELPGEAEIRIPVGEEWALQRLYYYEVKDNGEYVYIDTANVDSLGGFTIKQDHCSSYVALTKQLDLQNGVMLGDVDMNRTVNLLDAQLALRAALHLTQLTDEEKARADVDGITGVTLKDAQMILRAALHLIVLE